MGNRWRLTLLTPVESLPVLPLHRVVKRMTIHRYGLISDTHGNLHPRVFELFDGVEAIFHAGDVVGEEILDELETIAPTQAVCGNCDYGETERMPAERILDLPFGRMVLTHSHLVAAGRGHQDRLAAHFKPCGPRVILYGHSHTAYTGLHDGVWIVNPGSAGKPRFQDVPSVMVLSWDSGRDTLIFDLVELDWRSPRSR